MAKVDEILFLLRQGRDILIMQVYVDDIVFGGSSNSLVARFAEDMSREFEMRMMGELQFFLGLQIKQSKEGTFVHQGHCEEVQDGGFQGHGDAYEYDYNS
jgi:N-dimethylarginine dimethylaminohydrolase